MCVMILSVGEVEGGNGTWLRRGEGWCGLVGVRECGDVSRGRGQTWVVIHMSAGARYDTDARITPLSRNFIFIKFEKRHL